MADDDRSAALARVRLDAPVAELARPQVDEWAVRRMWEGIQRRKSPAAPNERRYVVALAGFAALASVLALAVAGAQLLTARSDPSLQREAALRETALKAAARLPIEQAAPDALAPAQPSITQPSITQPSITQPSITQPSSVQPSIMQPSSVPSPAPVPQGAPPEPLLTRDARPFELLEAPALPAPASASRTAHARAPAAATSAVSARVDFTDGSSIEAAPGTRVEALTSSPGEFAVMVRRGLAQFHVTPGGPRRWRIEASHARVEVLGTVLSVESDDAGTSVRVDEGHVLVRSPELPGGSQHVAAGQTLRLGQSSRDNAGEPGSRETATADANDSRAVRGASASAPASGERASSADAATTARRRSRVGNATAAAALWEGVDSARRNGQPARAAVLLARLVEEHPADSQVALAAFTLGVLELDQLARPLDAAESFQRALELGIGAALREDAYLRWADALAQVQDHARLALVSAEYARLFPRGRHRAAILRLERESAPTPPPASTPRRSSSSVSPRAGDEP